MLMIMKFASPFCVPTVAIVDFLRISLNRSLLFSLPIPLLNSGAPLLTAISDRTAVPPSSRTSTATSSSPTFRTCAPASPAATLMVVVPVIILSAMTAMRPLLMAPMPVRTPASASAVPSMVLPKQLTPQLPANSLQVHEVAISTTVASILFILPASSFSKIRYWREIHNNWPTSIKPSGEVPNSISSMLLLSELNIHIPHHMVGEVVTDIKAFDISILGELIKEVFIELLEVVLDLARVYGLPVGINARCYHVGPLVHVRKKNCWAYAGLCVETRAPIAVPARADLEVERAIHPVFLRPENRC